VTKGLASLRRFLVDQRGPAPAAEVCELCATPVPAQHPHLVQVMQRRMLCACGPCGFLFSNPGAGGGEYRRVPDRYLSDPGFTLSDAQWDALQIPVGMAFFLHNSVLGTAAQPTEPTAPADPPPAGGSGAKGRVVACYPSPAGATESELGMDAFTTGVGAGRLGAELEPDVEALLVRRGRPGGAAAQAQCLLVPIDACYRLVGLVRRYWRGFDGGTEAWRAIDAYFAELQDRAVPVGPPVGRG